MVERAMLVERWYDLTRHILPGMAARQGWPIERDHCFMRVCLDEAVGAPWTDVVRRPAVHSMTPDQLAAAVGVAEAIVAQAGLLVPLNERSLERRRAARRLKVAHPVR